MLFYILLYIFIITCLIYIIHNNINSINTEINNFINDSINSNYINDSINSINEEMNNYINNSINDLTNSNYINNSINDNYINNSINNSINNILNECQVPTLNSEQCYKSSFYECPIVNGNYLQCTNNYIPKPSQYNAECNNRTFEMVPYPWKISENCYYNKINFNREKYKKNL